MSSWSRLIRFTPASSPNTELYGEPIGSDFSDIGSLLERGTLEARVVKVGADGPLAADVQVTDKVEKVGKLLSPIAQKDCPIVRCIGLNYKAHSEPTCPFDTQVAKI